MNFLLRPCCLPVGPFLLGAEVARRSKRSPGRGHSAGAAMPSLLPAVRGTVAGRDHARLGAATGLSLQDLHRTVAQSARSLCGRVSPGVEEDVPTLRSGGLTPQRKPRPPFTPNYPQLRF